MTQRDTEKQPLGARAAPIGDDNKQPVDQMDEVLRQLAAIKQGLALSVLPAIPLDAFLTMLRDEFRHGDAIVQTAVASSTGKAPPSGGSMAPVRPARWRAAARSAS